MTDDRLLSTACTKIGNLGWAFYFVPATMERGGELGIDGFRFYFLGRGGVMGDVEAPVVVSAFGFFHPDLVTSMWQSGREKISPREAGAEYVGCCQRFGREKLSDVDGLEAFCRAAEAINVAASQRLAGLPLYAGWAGQQLPDDPPARAMQLMTTLRELRGSAHVAAVVTSGLSPRTAHYIKRPEMYSAFGYPDDDPPAVSDEDRALLVAAEETTDRQVLPHYAVLDHAGRRSLVDTLEHIEAALA